MNVFSIQIHMTSGAKTTLAMFSLLLLFFCAIVSVLSSPAISFIQCDPSDDQCVTKAVKAAYPLVLEANPDIGAEDLDPLYQEVIEGNLSILKFKLFKTNTEGFKSCQVEGAKFEAATLALQVVLLCPGFTLKGQYDINGRLIVLPVEGNGDYNLITKTYRLTIDAELKSAPGKDDKNYLSIKNFKLKTEPLEGVVFDFKNLFNGQKDLSDAVHKFANENWKEVANEVQEPVFTTNVKKIVKNANKYLKTIPEDEYLKL